MGFKELFDEEILLFETGLIHTLIIQDTFSANGRPVLHKPFFLQYVETFFGKIFSEALDLGSALCIHISLDLYPVVRSVGLGYLKVWLVAYAAPLDAIKPKSFRLVSPIFYTSNASLPLDVFSKNAFPSAFKKASFAPKCFPSFLITDPQVSHLFKLFLLKKSCSSI